MTTDFAEARNHLVQMGSALRYNTEPALDPVRAVGVTHPARFDLLTQSWTKCLDGARLIRARYDEDWNAGAGPLAVIAPQVRDFAIAELGRTWQHLVDAYINDIAAEEAA